MNIPPELIGEILIYTSDADNLTLFFVCKSLHAYILNNIYIIKSKVSDFCKDFDINQLSRYMIKYKEITFMFDLMRQELKMDIIKYREKQNGKYNKYRTKPKLNGRLGCDIGNYTNRSKELKIFNIIFEHVFGKNLDIKSSFGGRYTLDLDIILNKKARLMINAIGNKTYGDGERDMDTFIDVEYDYDEIIDILASIIYYKPLLNLDGSMYFNSDIPLIYDNLVNY